MAFGRGYDDQLPSLWESPVQGSLNRFPFARVMAATPLPLPRPVLDVAVSRLQLDETRRERIASARETIERRLRSDGDLGPLIRRVCIQGSFALGTAIRPASGTSFDVDALVVLDMRKLPLLDITPARAIELVESAVGAHAWYAKRIKRKPRCIRIQYEDGFHVDVVPAHSDTPYSASSGPAFIPSRSTDIWEETHPLAYQAWFGAIDRRNGGRLKQIVVLMKRWRDETARLEIPSILLTTLLALSVRGPSFSLAQSTAATLSELIEKLQGYRRVPRIPNPSLPAEDLARDWSQDSYERFKMALGEATRTANAALHANRDAKQHWHRLFGGVVPLGN